MKKIPTLFKREFENHRVTKALPELSDESLAWVLAGEGTATEKIDGACCAVIDGRFYKRFDAKKNKHGITKEPPAGAIPCDAPDPVTGHWPHWVPVDQNDSGDQWFLAAYTLSSAFYPDGTYEAVGLHFNGNPYCLHRDYLIRHGQTVSDLPDRSFDGIRTYLAEHAIEGIVFWKDGQPRCKIKRSDLRLRWPDKEHLSHIQHWVYELEAPEEYMDILHRITAEKDMTIEEMMTEGLKHLSAHPDIVRQWEEELSALPQEKKDELDRIQMKSVSPVYSDALWLQQHTEGNT